MSAISANRRSTRNGITSPQAVRVPAGGAHRRGSKDRQPKAQLAVRLDPRPRVLGARLVGRNVTRPIEGRGDVAKEALRDSRTSEDPPQMIYRQRTKNPGR